MSDTMRVIVQGPLWSGEAEIIEWKKDDQHFHDHRTIRNLLIARRERFDGRVGFLPGTFVALCSFLNVTVNLADTKHEWKNAAANDQFKAYQSLLLLQADPEKWQSGGAFPPCVCLAGEIDLSKFSQQDETWKEVFGPWDIEGKQSVDQPVVHSSGFSFHGAAKLPWVQTEKRIESLLWVSRQTPLPSDAPKDSLRLVPDFEAMTADEQFLPSIDQFKQAFRELSQTLSQAIKFGRDQEWQRWLFLDLVNKTGVAQFHWDYSPKSRKEPVFKLERGEVQLLLADQPPGEKDVEQRSVLSSSIEAQFETTNGIKIRFGDGQITMPFDRNLTTPPPIPNVLKEKLTIDVEKRAVSWMTGALLNDQGAALKQPLISDAEAEALLEFSGKTGLDSGLRRALKRLRAELKTPAHFLYNLSTTPSPSERIELVNLKTSYDAIETAALLRQQYSLPAPKAGRAVIEDSLLWGFMALEDGWAQLPFLNVTEQLYLDASVKPVAPGDPDPAEAIEQRPMDTPLLSGAATFGNDRSDIVDTQSSQQSWNVILLDGRQFSGVMEFNKDPITRNLKLVKATLVVLQPDIALNGFLWLGVEPPTAADALPPIENWVTGLRPISLRSIAAGEERPAPFILGFPSLKIHNETLAVAPNSDQLFSAPTLDDWAFVYSANTDLHPINTEQSVFETLLVRGLWAQLSSIKIDELKKTFWQDLPLVWRRHPQTPLIQSLPLTQNQTPPNHPAKSRQLVPFQLNVGQPVNNLLVPLLWRFGVTGSGASSFPLLNSASASAISEQWLVGRGLKMAALGLPGLALGRNQADLISFQGSDLRLNVFPPAQYFYGLPYTDELNALAQLPKDPDENNADDRPETSAPPPAMTRRMYSKFWADLSEKAELATVEADQVLAKVKVDDREQLVVQQLVAPFVWNLKSATVDAQTYPGSITLNDGAGTVTQLLGDSASANATLLRGIEGNFDENGAGELVKTAAGKYKVKAGSLKSAVEAGKIRDQAGILRAPTGSPQNQTLTTELLRQTKSGRVSTEIIKLCSRLESCDLEVDRATTWSLWFRDLPVINDQFERRRTQNSDTVEDINDPSARSGDRVNLTGYEWRLGLKNAPAPVRQFLPLFGFDFYPLRFERAAFDNTSKLKSIEVVGRLQLPTMPKEIPDLGNTVRVVFETLVDRLKLKSIHSEAAVETPEATIAKGRWELSEVSPHHPQLSWHELDYDSVDFVKESDGQLKVVGALDFFLFAARWVLTGVLRFTPGQTADPEFSFDPAQFSTAEPMGVRLSKAQMTFDRALFPKIIEAAITFAWGGSADVENNAPVRVEALAAIDLRAKGLSDGVNDVVQATLSAWLLYSSSQKAALEISAFSLNNGGLQFEIALAPTLKGLSLLPGMQLQPGQCRGFAAAGFSVDEKETVVSKRLRLNSGFVELILPCDWGVRLSKEQLGSSSSGSLFAGFTLAFDGNNSWKTKLLLNGSIEFTNLISWPSQKQIPDELRMVRFKPRGSEIADIILADQGVIAKVANFLKDKQNSDVNLRLEGHADSDGSYQGSMETARNRAKKVRDELNRLVGDNSRAELAIGFSSTLPIDSNVDIEGKQNNRRVEFVVDQVVLPAANPDGLTPQLNHLRHTLTVLLNQHEVPADLLGLGSNKILFNFRAAQRNREGKIERDGTSWQFLAATEHRLVDVTQVGNKFVTSDERRWTVVQEIRLVSPDRFEKFLSDLKDFKTINPTSPDQTKARSLPEVSFGYHREKLLEPLLKEVQEKRDDLRETLFVEASTVHWILPERKLPTDFTNLQYLPNAIQQAILSSPQDFAMRRIRRGVTKDNVRKPPEQENWLLLQMPFLGRLQDVTLDLAPAKWLLQRDPILSIDDARTQKQKLLDVWLSFTSMADKKSIRISLSDFDYSRFRRWRRLDPATLQESWFRLQHPDPEKPDNNSPLASVMSALPADSPGRLSRASFLNKLFDEFRGAFPPSPLPTPPKTGEPTPDDTLTWRKNNLFTLQGFEREGEDGTDKTNEFYGFHLVGAQLYTSPLVVKRQEPVVMFAAATALPANFKTKPDGKIDNEQPVSFAVSPYLALGTRPLLSPNVAEKILLSHAELLCLDAPGKNLMVIAGQLFPADNSDGDRATLVRQWATETADRLAGDSTIALARVRHIFEAKSGEEQLVRVEYEFLVLQHQPLKRLPAKSARRIRMDVAALRFAEGQFGGTAVPEKNPQFEVAPPQTRTVQPVHTEASEKSFGISGLHFKLRVFEKQKGLFGNFASLNASRRWWSVVSQHVQYELPEAKRILPPKFRAPAIKSLLPAMPNLDLSEETPFPLAETPAGIDGFQFVLPGSYSCVITGGRVGARYSMHNAILTQTINRKTPSSVSLIASGSVPVQHRMPRPVLLPKPDAGTPDRTLQTWASFFDPALPLKQTENPFDTAFFDGKTTNQESGFGMNLISSDKANALIKGGMPDSRDQVRLLTPDDEGRFWFLIDAKPDEDDFKNWKVEMSLVSGRRRLELTELTKPEPLPAVKGLYFSDAKFGENETAKAVMREFLDDQAHGSQALIEVKAERLDGEITRYKQTLEFPLTYSSSGLPPSSLRPVFTHFEDPEYNRRLSSPTAEGSRTYRHGPPGATKLTTLRLVADRREYNPTSEVNLVALSNRDAVVKGTIEVNRVDKESGNITTVEKRTDVSLKTLVTIDLKKVASPPLNDAESLLLLYKPDFEGGQEIQVRVDIVRRPVIPVPDAAFALLRSQQGQGVECRRFAWSPTPTRIELIDPADLLAGFVRRRAIFQWTDTTRSGIVNKYSLQKIKPSGSTHFPSMAL